MRYDLRYEPWIACEFTDGTKRKIGLVELFEKAHEIRLFFHDNPLAEAALMRILLAISHRLTDGPADAEAWREAYEKGSYEKDAVKAYFGRWHDRFDLFHEKYPFMQAADLQMMDREGNVGTKLPTLGTLVHHIASGNNATLFDHRLDKDPVTFVYDEAVMAMLEAVFFSLGGTHKKSTNLCAYQKNCKHGIGVNGLWVFVQGESLFETLMLNTIARSMRPGVFENDAKPYWEDPLPNCNETMPEGYLDYLTFTGRLIRLVPESEGVRYVHFACGQSLKEPIADLFSPVKIEKNKERVLNASSSRALWRDSDTLFAYKDGRFSLSAMQQLRGIVSRKISSRPYRFAVYGLVNEKANPMGYLKEVFPVSLSLLRNPYFRETIKAALAFSEKGYKALYSALKTFSDESEISIDLLKSRSAERYWASLDLPFKALLKKLDEESACADWENLVQKEVREAYKEGVRPLIGKDGRMIEAFVLGEKRLTIKKGERR
jgi:CRISPR system Cascade subunit CasA